MIFVKSKAKTIVTELVKESENLIEKAKEANFLHSNYYGTAECALIALGQYFSEVYSKGRRLGKAIVNNYLKNSFRTKVTATSYNEYEKDIQWFYDKYDKIVKDTYNNSELNAGKRMDEIIMGIARIIAEKIKADVTDDSLQFFATNIMLIKGQLEKLCK